VRLLICAGGTGGGVYPALSIAQALAGKTDEVLWVGGQNSMEMNLVQRAGLAFRGIPAAGLHGVGIKSLPRNLFLLAKGTTASRRILKEFNPDVLLFTGGFVAVPMALAGRKLPSLLYVPDIEPGLALKSISRFSKVIALSVEESKKYFKQHSNLVVTGYPTRSDLSVWQKQKALLHFNLTTKLPVLLVLGGSKGARSINQSLVPILPELLKFSQVIHITGELDYSQIEKTQNGLDSQDKKKYHVFPYLHEDIGAAFAAADLAVSRAGASVLGEYPLFGLPAILVPYPYAWRYQKVNADFLIQKNAAVLVRNEDLGVELLRVIQSLLSNPNRLGKMKKSMLALSTPNAAKKIAELMINLEKKGVSQNG
jgi:UDP-N-acetylglucosamine--N-acetylmuramyl-(pentapeptide) pyrophosphoryl-undecaprenol N-acetylglucosamine transferase